MFCLTRTLTSPFGRNTVQTCSNFNIRKAATATSRIVLGRFGHASPRNIENLVKQWHSIQAVWEELNKRARSLQKNHTHGLPRFKVMSFVWPQLTSVTWETQTGVGLCKSWWEDFWQDKWGRGFPCCGANLGNSEISITGTIQNGICAARQSNAFRGICQFCHPSCHSCNSCPNEFQLQC